MQQASLLIRLLIAALAISFVAVSANAGVNCIVPPVDAAAAMPADCPDMPKAHDCALACPPMCAAIKDISETVAERILEPSVPATLASAFLPTRHIRPEPPPPRAG
jgi:hypothetical protein